MENDLLRPVIRPLDCGFCKKELFNCFSRVSGNKEATKTICSPAYNTCKNNCV